MGRYGDLDYPTLTKGGVVLGLSMFVVGIVGGKAGPALFGHLPAWEMTLLIEMAELGVIVTLLSPFIFGIFLPLTE